LTCLPHPLYLHDSFSLSSSVSLLYPSPSFSKSPSQAWAHRVTAALVRKSMTITPLYYQTPQITNTVYHQRESSR
jgi:hypothetical protein